MCIPLTPSRYQVGSTQYVCVGVRHPLCSPSLAVGHHCRSACPCALCQRGKRWHRVLPRGCVLCFLLSCFSQVNVFSTGAMRTNCARHHITLKQDWRITTTHSQKGNRQKRSVRSVSPCLLLGLGKKRVLHYRSTWIGNGSIKVLSRFHQGSIKGYPILLRLTAT